MVDITKIKSEITLDIFGEGNQKIYLEGLVDEYGLANQMSSQTYPLLVAVSRWGRKILL